jgi:hypothetical protein
MIKNRKKYIKNIKNINYILWKKNIFFPGKKWKTEKNKNFPFHLKTFK